MKRQNLLRVGVYFLGIFLIVFVLFLSITRQTLYAPTLAEREAMANFSASSRLRELTTLPFLPDHPIYPVLMVRDRVSLFFLSPSKKTERKLELADKRLESAQLLLQKKRSALALTTVSKAEKYVLSASLDVGKSSGPASTADRNEIQKKIATHAVQLELMKPHFSDEQRAVIDRLLSELSVVQQQLQ